MSARCGNTKNRELTKLDAELLILIGTGENRNQLLHERLIKADDKKVSKSTISRHTSKLAKLGLITQRAAFNQRIFDLTDRGKDIISNLLAGGEGDLAYPRFPIRGHNIRFRSDIARRPEGLVKKLRETNWVEYYPQSWIGYRKEVDGCNILLTSKSVIFMPPPTYGSSAEECMAEACAVVLRVKKEIEDNYPGLVLGKPERVSTILKQHYARPFDPAAIRLHQENMKEGHRSTYMGERLSVDYSTGIPELETTDRVSAQEDFCSIMGFYEDFLRYEKSWGELMKWSNGVEAMLRLLVSTSKISLSSSLTLRNRGYAQLASSFSLPNALFH
jgi:DNA-binding MarR family transcriptional regulator